MTAAKKKSLLLVAIVLALVSIPLKAAAQVEAPDRKFLFIEDKGKTKREEIRKRQLREKRKRLQQQRQGPSSLPFDINARSIRYDTVADVVEAEGNLIVGYATSIIEADKGRFGVKSKEAELSGDVRISDLNGTLSGDKAQINLETGVGKLVNGEIEFTEGNYSLEAKEIRKVGAEDYELDDALMTTCRCPEPDDCPWRIVAPSAEVTRNGYGIIHHGLFEVNKVPVFYMPWLLFPAKTERQSGFLPATFGSGRRTGFELQVPFFLVFDDSSDATITGITETKVRTGVDVEVRDIFSLNHKLETGGTYLNESQRNGQLYGTNISGLADPTIGENRFAGYWHESWRHNFEGQRVQYIADVNYVSDDLILREFDRPKIGEYNDTFVTSDVILRTSLFDTYSADISGEFNQAMVEDDDFIFQRLPEGSVAGFSNWRPFGENPYGLKVVFNSDVTSTNFVRKVGYDGLRTDGYEQIKLPFHFKNYFDAVLNTDVHATQYNLTDTELVTFEQGEPTAPSGNLPSSSDRVVPGLGGTLSTVFERVFQVPSDNSLKEIAELGPTGRTQELTRLKHTIEPTLKYRFVPFVDQSENPLFDSYDHLSQRNVATYGVTQRLYGRYDPRDEFLYGVEETTPELSDLPALESSGPLDSEFGFGFERDLDTNYRSLRRGARRELANLSVYQSYDLLEAEKDRDPNRTGYSDIGIGTKLFPNDHARFEFGSNFNPQNSSFDSYSIGTQLIDKRGDELRELFTYIDNPNGLPVRQLETALQFALTDRLKVGYYSRYDDVESEFMENKAGFRLTSACKCWIFDLSISDRINPNQTRLMFNITLNGLGEFGDTFYSLKQTQSEEL